MDKKLKCKRLTKAEKEILSSVPEAYREQYGKICGTTWVSSNFREYKVFVTSDGKLMQASQPFLLEKEEDLKPQYFNSKEKAAERLYSQEMKFKHQETERTLKQYCTSWEAGTQFWHICTFCPTGEEGWHLVIANLQPTEWIVVEDTTPGWGYFLLNWIIPGPTYHVDDTLELNDSRKARIMEVRKAESHMVLPLVRLKFITDEEYIIDDRVKQCIREGVTDKEVFVTESQARTLFYDKPAPGSGVSLRCRPGGRKFEYIPVTKLKTDNMYLNFKRKFNRILYANQMRTLEDFLRNAGHGEGAEITFEETLCCMTDWEYGSTFPETVPLGWEELFREKVAVPFIRESGFWADLTEKQSVEKLCSYFQEGEKVEPEPEADSTEIKGAKERKAMNGSITAEEMEAQLKKL